MKLKKNLMFGVAAFALAVSPVMAETTTTYDPSEDQLTVYQYDMPEYSDVDMNTDNIVSEPEFYTYSYDLADYDNDNVISTNEFESYVSTFMDPRDIDYREVNFYDTDNDGMLDQDEYVAFIDDTDLYVDYDVNNNGQLERQEYLITTRYYN